jgi:uncharacterized RDD family membrane protein YckC
MSYPPSSWQQPAEPMGPAPGVRFAGHGARLGAYIIDAFIVGFVVAALVTLASLPVAGRFLDIVLTNPDRLEDPATWADIWPQFAFFMIATTVISVLAMLYFPFFWARGGQTPGMMVAGLRVVSDRDGSRIGWGTALLRLVGYWVSGAVFSLGFIWVLVDARRRGWHDLLAGTCVIATR